MYFEKSRAIGLTDIADVPPAAPMANMSSYNEDYLYHDFRENPFESKVDAVYLIDVIEHIFEEEENNFMTNLASSLNKKGVCIIGTPNKAAEKYASPIMAGCTSFMKYAPGQHGRRTSAVSLHQCKYR